MKSKKRKRICFISSTRAEYGLLSGLMKAINNDSDFELQIIATNMHLSAEFGLTYKDEDELVLLQKKMKSHFEKVIDDINTFSGFLLQLIKSGDRFYDYLKETGCKLVLLVNFGGAKLEIPKDNQ